MKATSLRSWFHRHTSVPTDPAKLEAERATGHHDPDKLRVFFESASTEALKLSHKVIGEILRDRS